jgi:hypothetical protein
MLNDERHGKLVHPCDIRHRFVTRDSISSFQPHVPHGRKSVVLCHQTHSLSARRLKRRRSARLIPSAGIESASEVAKIDN